MTEYKGIKGGAVQSFEEDPDNPHVGQVWYNETTGNLRVRQTTLTSAWAMGGNMNTARNAVAASGFGTQTASIVFGGTDPTASPTNSTKTESYNGSSFTEVNDLNTGTIQFAGAGTQTSALGFGGRPGPSTRTAETESWNGTNWTEVNDLNTARNYLGGCGASNTSALAFGGYSTAHTGATELWNGSNWTEVNDLNTARAEFWGGGIATSALAFGGETSPTSELGNTEA